MLWLLTIATVQRIAKWWKLISGVCMVYGVLSFMLGEACAVYFVLMVNEFTFKSSGLNSTCTHTHTHTHTHIMISAFEEMRDIILSCISFVFVYNYDYYKQMLLSG